jgi:coenzyme F420-dependent glucose-6-phosphate dehydrogenase
MLLEAIELIRALWTGEEVTSNGKYYCTRKAKLFTRPEKPIPLYISTMVPRSAGFAGKYGDGLFTVGGGKPELCREILKNFEAGAEEAGKDPSRMPRLIELNVAYTDDREAVIDSMLRYWAGSFVPAVYSQNIYTAGMSAMNGAVVGRDTVEKRMLISSDPEEHVMLAKRYIDMGYTHLFFHFAGPDQMGFLKDYGREVLPKIRDNLKPSGKPF